MIQRKELFRVLWPLIVFVVAITTYTYNEFIFGQLIPQADLVVAKQLSMAASWFSGAWLLGRIVGTSLRRKRNGRRKTPRLLGELISAALFLAATAATVAMMLGQSAGGALASSGLMIAILGFAIRNVLADVLSGVALGLEAPFRIGDWIAIDGSVRGRVIEIGWRTTRLQTRNDIYMILPNSEIARQRVVNFSAPRKHYRAELEIVLGHDIPVSKARTLLEEASLSNGIILQTPRPDVRALSYDTDGVKYVVRYWVPSFVDDVDCRDVMISAIDRAIRKSGLPAPYSRIKVLSSANDHRGAAMASALASMEM